MTEPVFEIDMFRRILLRITNHWTIAEFAEAAYGADYARASTVRKAYLRQKYQMMMNNFLGFWQSLDAGNLWRFNRALALVGTGITEESTAAKEQG